MHELNIAIELFRISCSELEAHGGERLESVSIQVGELSGVEPELLPFAWQAVTAGTRSAAARLFIERVPAVQRCADCGVIRERQPGTWLRLCPHCEGPLRVEGGDVLDVVAITYTQAEITAEVHS